LTVSTAERRATLRTPIPIATANVVAFWMMSRFAANQDRCSSPRRLPAALADGSARRARTRASSGDRWSARSRGAATACIASSVCRLRFMRESTSPRRASAACSCRCTSASATQSPPGLLDGRDHVHRRGVDVAGPRTVRCPSRSACGRASRARPPRSSEGTVLDEQLTRVRSTPLRDPPRLQRRPVGRREMSPDLESGSSDSSHIDAHASGERSRKLDDDSPSPGVQNSACDPSNDR
jgi:hypothetical protein